MYLKKASSYLIKVVCSVFLVAVLGCSSNSGEWDKNKKVETKVTDENNDFLVTISTEHGDMKAILFSETPQHRENFVKLIRQGFYQDLLFHRVIKEFMLQGGDPDSRNAGASADLGGGDVGYLIPAEIKPELRHVKGALAAARKGNAVNPEKKSSGCQFYIVDGKKYKEEELRMMKTDIQGLYKYFTQLLQKPEYEGVKIKAAQLQMVQDQNGYKKLMMSVKDSIEKEFNVELDKPLSEQDIENYTTVGGTPFLDDEYTVFGQVVEGLDIVDKIAITPVGKRDRPKEDVKMTITIEELPKSEISQRYNYKY